VAPNRRSEHGEVGMQLTYNTFREVKYTKTEGLTLKTS